MRQVGLLPITALNQSACASIT